MEKTGGKLNRKTLIGFQNWYMNQYDSYDVLRKYYTYTRAFLEYVYKVTGNPLARDLKDILDKPERPSKKINPIIIREDDVRNIVRATYNLPRDPHVSVERHVYSKIKFIAAILLAAYTGQRPDATIAKLDLRDLEDALSRETHPSCGSPRRKTKSDSPTGSLFIQ